jgi:polysaccharide export outer membrane protein
MARYQLSHQTFQILAAVGLIGAAFTPALAQVPSAPTVFNSTSVSRPSYILGPGDQVDIRVFDYAEFTGPRTILPDGTITMPLLGQIPASGRTPEQLSQDLSNRLKVYLVNPVVTVSLATLRPVTVNVSGEVQRPGPVQLRSLTTANQIQTGDPNSTEGPASLSVALRQAGGITQSADIRRVIVTRNGVDGSRTTTVINLWDAVASNEGLQDPILQDGDSVYVSRLNAGDSLDRRLTTRSSFAPATIRVRVVGEVRNPGEVQVPPNSSLSSAVAIAGGPTTDARLSRVAFIRLNEVGQVERQIVNLENLTDTIQIQDGDVLIVPKKQSSSFLDFAGRLLGPVGGLLNLFRGW